MIVISEVLPDRFAYSFFQRYLFVSTWLILWEKFKNVINEIVIRNIKFPVCTISVWYHDCGMTAAQNSDMEGEVWAAK